jgi:hypothetical protein
MFFVPPLFHYQVGHIPAYFSAHPNMKTSLAALCKLLLLLLRKVFPDLAAVPVDHFVVEIVEEAKWRERCNVCQTAFSFLSTDAVVRSRGSG